MKRISFIFIFVFFYSLNSTSAQNYWKHLDGPDGGYVQDIIAGEGDNLFAGIISAGVFYSTDKGASWYSFNSGIKNKDISALAYCPYDDALFACTSDGIYKMIFYIYLNNPYSKWTLIKTFPGNKVLSLAIDMTGCIYAGTQSGLYYSKDYGENWIKANNIFSNKPVNKVVISTSKCVFAVSGSNLYRTIDKGDNWTNISEGLGNHIINSLLTDSSGVVFTGTDTGIFYSSNNGDTWGQKNNSLVNTLVTELLRDSKNNLFAGTYDKGLYQSNDNGETWFQVNTTLNSYRINSLTEDYNGNIFAGTSWGVFCSTDSGNEWVFRSKGLNQTKINVLEINKNDHIFVFTNGGLIRSTDNGENWVQINNGFENFIGGNCIAFNTGGSIFAGFGYNRGVYRSTDNGENWTPVNNGLDSNNINKLIVNSKGYVFAATGLGLYRSTDNGENWMRIINGLENKSISTLFIDSSDKIYAGSSDGMIFYSSDSGDNWISINSSLNPNIIYTLAVNSKGDLFVGTFDEGLLRSTDKGNTWVKVNNGLTGTWIRDVIIDVNNDIFTATANGVYYSFDNGENWSKMNSGLEDKDIFVLAFNSKENLYSGSYSGGIYSNLNPGKSPMLFPLKVGNRWDYKDGWWSPNGDSHLDTVVYRVVADTLMPNGKIYYIIKPKNYHFFKDFIRADTDGLYFYDTVCNKECLYYNFDLSMGESFEVPNSPCTSTDIKNIFIEYIYTANILGENMPITRFSYDSGIDDAYTVSISKELGFTDEDIPSFFANYGCSLIGCELSGVVYGKLTSINEDDQQPRSFILSQNYPNPFNPVTTISYSIPSASFASSGKVKQSIRLVTLKIYDILGREVSVLVNKELSPGNYKVKFDGSRFPSGAYFYKLQSGEFTEIKKMLLLK